MTPRRAVLVNPQPMLDALSDYIDELVATTTRLGGPERSLRAHDHAQVVERLRTIVKEHQP